ncbi:MAG: DUF4038 domain-containing protein [Anaerolineae bacterium]|nr:DUF4038 domain-containing protein [Anaerolineae bacterium]
MHAIAQHVVHEWSFSSTRRYADPFNEVELDVLFSGPEGTTQRVPAFWAGEGLWRVRFSTPLPGVYSYQTICSDAHNADLHDQVGEFEVTPYRDDADVLYPNALLAHGPLRVATDRRHLEHADGTPFFWLADTWWMGLCRRLDWPRGFQTLALDRVEKGFTVIQIVAGPYPDMPQFDPRGVGDVFDPSEAGFPWQEDNSRINPAYFDAADRRIQYLVDVGLSPCIVGCWGYYLRLMGIDRIKRHWRYLVARYGAYPVIWCLAGEQTMPYYLSQDKPADEAFQRQGWSEVAAYVRQVDPYRRLITVHPGQDGREQMSPPTLIDLEMLQTGHSDRQSLPNTVQSVIRAVGRTPAMPVIDAEVCYEGIGEASRQEVQRLMFWVCMLNGAAGHTYGANGIWQINTPEQPYGPSPHGLAWGNTPWPEAMRLPGSRQVGLSKRLLERYEWWRFEPHPEWVDPHWDESDYFRAYAAGIPGQLRVVFWPSTFSSGLIKHIEPGVPYRAFLFNPVNGDELPLDAVVPDENGDWALPIGNAGWRVMPLFQDWVLVMERME